MKNRRRSIIGKEGCCGTIRGILVVLAIIMAVALGVTTGAWAAPFAYVANSWNDTVSVIDTATNTVIAAVGVGDLPYNVAITTDGAFAYVTNFVSDTVSVIDTATNTVIATIPIGDGPNRPAVTPDGTRVYVPNGTSDSLSVIDVSTNTVIATLAVGDDPRDIAITPDGTRAYVINTGSGTVSVIDTDPVSGTFHNVIDTISLGGSSLGIAITPDGAFAYLSVRIGGVPGVGKVAVVDIRPTSPTLHTVVAWVYVEELTGGNLTGVAITPDGTRAYVLSNQSNTIYVINTADNTVSHKIYGISGQGQIAITPDGSMAYVTNGFWGVDVIDINPASSDFHKVIATILLGYYVGPSGIAITPIVYPNRPPVANAGPDQTVSAGADCQAMVTLDGTGSFDPDEDDLTYKWTGPFGTANGPTLTVSLPLGTHTVTLTVEDGKGGMASDNVEVTVEDKTPPSISTATVNPSVLWPPNHKMVDVMANYTVADNCGGTTCSLSVTSNEPIEGTGDGDMAPDWEIVGPNKVRLRAERAGSGTGRIYTVTITCTDSTGNSSKQTVIVNVPHDQGKK